MRQVITGSAGYCRCRASSAALVYPELQDLAAAGDGIVGSGGASPVVLWALGGGAAPLGDIPGGGRGLGQARGSKAPREAAARVAVGSPDCCRLGAAWWVGNAASETWLLNIDPGHDQRRQGPCTSLLARFPP